VETTASPSTQGLFGQLQKISDEVFLLPGVDRAFMKSCGHRPPSGEGVTEEGFGVGPVIPNDYSGTPTMWPRCGATWSAPARSVPSRGDERQVEHYLCSLLAKDPDTNQILHYGKFSERLEKLREKYQSPREDPHHGLRQVLGI